MDKADGNSREVRRWLVEVGESGIIEFDLPDVTALDVLSRAPRIVPVYPDLILDIWRQQIFSYQRVADQAKVSFLEQAQRAGWDDSRTANALRIPAGQTIADYRSRLEDRLARNHPSQWAEKNS